MSGRRGLGRGLEALIRPAAPVDGGAAEQSAKAAPAPASVVATGTTSPASVPTLPTGRGTVAARAAAEKQAERSLSVPVAGAFFAELPLDAITPNPRQPREVFDEDKLVELINSIKEVGLLQPIVVRQVGAERFELIMGERRWRASREAGLERIPAIVRATEDDKLLLDALLENLHRAELNPLEEAAAYDQLLRDFSCTHEELADRIGRSRTHVSNTLRLMKLPASVQRRLVAGTLMAGHARALLGVQDAEAQEQLAARIIAEGLSVRSVEEIVMLMRPEEERKPKRQAPKAGKLNSPAFNDLASRLSDRFDTRVKVEVSQRAGKLGKGKVVLEFGSVEDLNRILDSMAPGEDGLRLSQG
ncbi:ParB/RepB/Spo0J family partition protein [Streptomyces sp. FH025]|uniref:ParB/RepB/Spo0J family partition protein n=1 Tax=Streptomyces sp. FH025 TaxID=2815937 RepID=UPI001A9DDC1B|nr:ParB/RepB/Spo0J family partition protein [Streptomyces sp. FH025]MBO1416941.1 ParB/RepB/Spo0J family partition protein [Streptomyces sp. FH025]